METMKDKFEGAKDSVVGNAKATVGKVTSDDQTAAKGEVQEKKGDTTLFAASLKERILESSHRLGDSIEHAGRRLREKGYSRLGDAIEKIGNTIEHIAD